MKHCPVCNTQYDEEILRFCTKDGTPLIEEDQPNFSAMPSQSIEADDDDIGQETVIRRNPPTQPIGETPTERIVIPTTDERQQQVRSRPIPPYVPPPSKPNTAKIVFLTLLCTFAVLGGIAGVVYLLRGNSTPTNSNTNLNANLFNQNTTLNTNLNIDANFNPNYNLNLPIPNVNSNSNFNKTPTPTKTPTPSPSPTASPSPSPSATPAKTPSPSPSATPKFPHDPGPPRMSASPSPRRSP
jgi:hypothetical protein